MAATHADKRGLKKMMDSSLESQAEADASAKRPAAPPGKFMNKSAAAGSGLLKRPAAAGGPVRRNSSEEQVHMVRIAQKQDERRRDGFIQCVDERDGQDEFHQQCCCRGAWNWREVLAAGQPEN